MANAHNAISMASCDSDEVGRKECAMKCLSVGLILCAWILWQTEKTDLEKMQPDGAVARITVSFHEAYTSAAECQEARTHLTAGQKEAAERNPMHYRLLFWTCLPDTVSADVLRRK